MNNTNIQLLFFLITIHLTALNTTACFGQEQQFNESIHFQLAEYDSILSQHKLDGSILIYDLNKDIYYSNDFGWAMVRRLPASTFKVPHTIIALSTGVMADRDGLIKWDGKSRFLKSWERDLTLMEALQLSCVPCYQHIASKVGLQNMQSYLQTIDFGQMEVNDDNLKVFWLEGNSGISQFEQIDFYRRLYHHKLNIPAEIQNQVKEMIILEEREDYRLSGKTGWAIRNGHNNGWFVGYLEIMANVYFFATNVDPEEEFDMSLFPVIRKEVTQMALDYLMELSNKD